MVKAAILSLSMVLMAAVEPSPPEIAPEARRHLTPHQKNAVVQPLMRTATDCVIDAVSGHPRFSAGLAADDLNELIVASMDACTASMQAMIEAYDRLFGYGTGEAFFMGPYLDVLPKAVARQVKGDAP